jgi:hypothetical protein
MKYYSLFRARIVGLVTIAVFILSSANATTPILSEFEAHTNGETVVINWVAGEQINNAYFTIEKSKDGVNFEEMAVVAAAGNSSSTIEYFEVDHTPLTGISYYRLKQTGENGEQKHFNIVPVAYYPSAEPNMSLFPDPENTGEIPVELDELKGKDFVVVLRDLAGKEAYSKVRIVETQNELVAVDLDSRLSEGTYFVTSSSADELYSRTLVIKAG